MERYEHIVTPEQIKEAIGYSPRIAGGGNSNIPVEDELHVRLYF